MASIEVGAEVPDFFLKTDGGDSIRSSDLKGHATVIYFYPKDDSTACRSEALDFSRLKERFDIQNCVVLGISPDSVESHNKFKKKRELSLRLASDGDNAVAEAFGVWVEKSMYGRKYMGVERATFLIEADGKVARIWRKVKVAGHAEEVLAAVAAL